MLPTEEFEVPMPPERWRGVVDGGGVERDELVVAAAVEREMLDLALIDEAGGLLGRKVDHRGLVLDRDLLLDGIDRRVRSICLLWPTVRGMPVRCCSVNPVSWAVMV